MCLFRTIVCHEGCCVILSGYIPWWKTAMLLQKMDAYWSRLSTIWPLLSSGGMRPANCQTYIRVELLKRSLLLSCSWHSPYPRRWSSTGPTSQVLAYHLSNTVMPKYAHVSQMWNVVVLYWLKVGLAFQTLLQHYNVLADLMLGLGVRTPAHLSLSIQTCS